MYCPLRVPAAFDWRAAVCDEYLVDLAFLPNELLELTKRHHDRSFSSGVGPTLVDAGRLQFGGTQFGRTWCRLRPSLRPVGTPVFRRPRRTRSGLEPGRWVSRLQRFRRFPRCPRSLLALRPWRHLVCGLRGGPDQGSLDGVSRADAKPFGCLGAEIDLLAFQIGHREGLSGLRREAIEAPHGIHIHAQHVYPRLGEVSLR